MFFPFPPPRKGFFPEKKRRTYKMPALFTQQKADFSAYVEKSACCLLILHTESAPAASALDGAILLTRVTRRSPLVGRLTFSQGSSCNGGVSSQRRFAASDAFLHSQCRSRGVYPRFFCTAAWPRGGVAAGGYTGSTGHIHILFYYRGHAAQSQVLVPLFVLGRICGGV